MDLNSILAAIFTPQVTDAVVTSVVGIVVAIIGIIGRAAVGYLKANTSASQFEFLQTAALQAVLVAEQLHLNNIISDKKAVAEGIVARELAARGITVTAEQLDAAIEAAVMATFNYGKALAADPMPESAPAAA